MNGKISLLCVVLLTEGARRAGGSRDVMNALTVDFTKALDACKAEMNLPDTINRDFLNLWKEGYELSERTTGCAIICLASKLGLVRPDGGLHHANTQEFTKKHGADERTAKRLAVLLLQCESAAPAAGDTCLRALGVVKCFQAEIRDMKWAPDVQLTAGDALVDIK